MIISREMVEKAAAIAPVLSEATVRQMLEAALSGGIVMLAGKGQVIEEGKSRFPDYMQIEVSDVYSALDLSRQLITAVQQQPGVFIMERPVLLLLAGEAAMSYDD